MIETDCLNCLYSFSTENKFNEHEKVSKNRDYCFIEMPKEGSILKFNHEEKPMKILFIIYSDLKSSLDKINTCRKSPEKLSTAKINKHTGFGYSIFTQCLLTPRSKPDYCTDKDCMKNFSKDLKRRAANIISYEKKEMIPLTYEENRSYCK